MYRKRYYRNQKRRYDNSDPDFIEMFVGIIIGIMDLITDLIVKLFSVILNRNTTSKKLNTSNLEPPKYDLKPNLLTPPEISFSKVLQEVAGNRYQIVPQVQLSRIVNVHNSNSHYTNYHDFNLIKAKSIDFVLFDNNVPKVAIELDDNTHSLPERIKRDEFVNKVMAEIGLPIIHVPRSSIYDKEKLASQIFSTNQIS